jgi:hypothetical protein
MPEPHPTWTPRPVDTSAAVIPPSLNGLIETIAENNHNVWAAVRLREGWRYGPTRDDLARTNPTLVPYAQLPESEKEVDRQTAIEVVRLLLTLGYRIIKDDATLP